MKKGELHRAVFQREKIQKDKQRQRKTNPANDRHSKLPDNSQNSQLIPFNFRSSIFEYSAISPRKFLSVGPRNFDREIRCKRSLTVFGNLVWPIVAGASGYVVVSIILNNSYCLTSKYLRHFSETGPHLFQPTSFPVSLLLNR